MSREDLIAIIVAFVSLWLIILLWKMVLTLAIVGLFIYALYYLIDRHVTGGDIDNDEL